MTQHEQIAGDLTRYLLGELSAGERSEVERHLGACGECRAELQRLHGDASVLALTSPPTAPPPRARARLLAAIAREPRLQVAAGGSRHRALWWAWIPSFAALALAIAVGLLWRENTDLRNEATEMTGMLTQYELDAQKTKEVMTAMTAPGTVRATLTEAGYTPQARGKASYNPRSGDVVLVASDLKQLPPDQTYQLWLVPTAGGKLVAAGSFKPDAHGHAVVMQHNGPKMKARMFAVTIEPQQGNLQPSTPVILQGGGE